MIKFLKYLDCYINLDNVNSIYLKENTYVRSKGRIHISQGETDKYYYVIIDLKNEINLNNTINQFEENKSYKGKLTEITLRFNNKKQAKKYLDDLICAIYNYANTYKILEIIRHENKFNLIGD